MRVFIDKTNQRQLDDSTVLRTSRFPLPDTRSYLETGLLVRTDYGSAPMTTFALVDGAYGRLWVPVEAHTITPEDLTQHAEYDEAMSFAEEVQ